jgi:hypothetical protein
VELRDSNLMMNFHTKLISQKTLEKLCGRRGLDPTKVALKRDFQSPSVYRNVTNHKKRATVRALPCAFPANTLVHTSMPLPPFEQGKAPAPTRSRESRKRDFSSRVRHRRNHWGSSLDAPRPLQREHLAKLCVVGHSMLRHCMEHIQTISNIPHCIVKH